MENPNEWYGLLYMFAIVVGTAAPIAGLFAILEIRRKRLLKKKQEGSGK